MVVEIGTQQNFKKIPVLGLVAETAASAPGTPVNGQIYYDTATDRFYGREGGSWVLLSNTGTISTTDNAGGDLSGTFSNLQIVASAVGTTEIADDAVTFAKIQNIATDRLLGRDTATSGDVEEISVSGGIEFTGAGGIQTSAFTGDVTKTAGGTSLSIADQAVVIGDINNALTLDSLATNRPATASITANSQKITNLGTPTADTDAATKAYVDAVKAGLDIKDSVRAATTADITLSGLQTIDGVALNENDRVLVKNQSTGSENGLYIASASTWVRTADANIDAEVTSGLYTFVSEGTTQADSGWVLTTNDPITLGSTSLTFTQFSGAGQITAGNGLTKTGNTLDVGGTTDRITVGADSIDIASTYVGQSSITTVGTLTTGTWSATTIAANKGGTGQSAYTIGDLLYADSTSTLAKLNIGASGTYLKSNGSGVAPSWATPAGTLAKYAATLGALTAGVETTITHSLGTEDVSVTFRAAADPKNMTILGWRVIDSNSVGVTADVAYSANAIRVVVMG